MRAVDRLLIRASRLPPSAKPRVCVERDLVCALSDATVLLADRYWASDDCPTILIRTPYGRRSMSYLGRAFAERGFQVLIQACRGTDGSGGVFHPFVQEHRDSPAVLGWIEQQPWFNGTLALLGASYMGYVQWPLAANNPSVAAVVCQLADADIRRRLYPGGAPNLDVFLRWAVGSGTGQLSPLKAARVEFRLNRAVHHLPLGTADVVAAGSPSPFWRDVVAHDHPDDRFWEGQDFSRAVDQVTAPVALFGGWYDFMLPGITDIYTRLRRAGRQPYLLIGPWAHGGWQATRYDSREAFAWLQACTHDDTRGLRRHPVRVFRTGSNDWCDFDDWPPTGYRPQSWHLHSNGRLSPQPPDPSRPDCYRYDPTDPTPAVGGIGQIRNFGPKNQRRLERRADVIVYTSEPVTVPLPIAGPVEVELHVSSNRRHTDFFACLCDVTPSGRSTNLSAGIFRVFPDRPRTQPDGTHTIAVALWPRAHTFQPGHRLRLQVSSGAHPHFARHPGTDEPTATAVRLLTADQQIFHDPQHPSRLIVYTSG